MLRRSPRPGGRAVPPWIWRATACASRSCGWAGTWPSSPSSPSAARRVGFAPIARPRLEVIRYVVQSGDTVFGIAENFNLNPQSILWGNYDVLTDDPHNLQPGQELNVPPVDGTLS